MKNLKLVLSSVRYFAEINDISKLILALISIGTIIKLVYLFISLSSGEDSSIIKKKIKNLLIFYIMALLSYAMIEILFIYLK